MINEFNRRLEKTPRHEKCADYIWTSALFEQKIMDNEAKSELDPNRFPYFTSSEMSLSSHISWESNFPNFDQNFYIFVLRGRSKLIV